VDNVKWLEQKKNAKAVQRHLDGRYRHVWGRASVRRPTPDNPLTPDEIARLRPFMRRLSVGATVTDEDLASTKNPLRKKRLKALRRAMRRGRVIQIERCVLAVRSEAL